MVHILGKNNSIFNQFIAELRDVNVQQDSMRFRRNLERIGEIFAYEISKSLSYKSTEITTPLGIAQANLATDQPVIGSILRAGLPLHQGILNYFDRAENAFVSAYRKPHKDGTFDIQVEYVSSPDLTDRILILADPMLATGASMVLTYKALLIKGIPKHTHFVAAIASAEGLEYAKRNLPPETTIWIGEVDDELTAQSYIVPGLGDAGDLAFGTKV
ncbi:MAG: uracil phosphoribosyltransferase [Bacteroidetes bacterium]|nr:uracil phosphoribosyltransferase [Bacteroidota bacterium]HET6243967.1 uracil phosphoribosyltransferase [Bacteroidia bacterium]